MERQPRKSSRNAFRIALVVIVLLAAAGTGIWHWQKTRPSVLTSAPLKESSSEGKSETTVVSEKLQTSPVLDYHKLPKDQNLQDMIETRKDAYGMKDSLDMILHEDESLKVGETVVPMKEILEKIRIKKGEIEEESLSGSRWEDSSADELTEVIDKLNSMEARYELLKKRLQSADSQLDPESRKKYLDELAGLENIISKYREYKTTLDALEETRTKLDTAGPEEKEPLDLHLKSLADKRNLLLKQLYHLVTPEKKAVEAYGIHVVQPRENIWNIHYNFLKDYFSQKGIALTSRADEPTRAGLSSGVGKILKFSETMVYIYNIRERKIEVDLNIIHPESKIVVFNMSEVLSLLDRIDYTNINKIVFDGDILWIPAEG
jgi:hypothetical protein